MKGIFDVNDVVAFAVDDDDDDDDDLCFVLILLS